MEATDQNPMLAEVVEFSKELSGLLEFQAKELSGLLESQVLEGKWVSVLAETLLKAKFVGNKDAGDVVRGRLEVVGDCCWLVFHRGEGFVV